MVRKNLIFNSGIVEEEVSSTDEIFSLINHKMNEEQINVAYEEAQFETLSVENIVNPTKYYKENKVCFSLYLHPVNRTFKPFLLKFSIYDASKSKTTHLNLTTKRIECIKM